MKSVLVISATDLARDPRVYRQLQALVGHCQLTALGCGDPHVGGVKYVPLMLKGKSFFGRLRSAMLLGLRRYDAFYSRSSIAQAPLDGLGQQTFDVIIANDVMALPLALQLGQRGSRVVFDAHEYSPREFEDVWWWRWLYQGFYVHLCRQYLLRADAMMTVCHGIAQAYQENFGVHCAVVTNAPDKRTMASPELASKGRVRMIHHGIAVRSRRLELMIELMRHLDQRFSLDLMLLPDRLGYVEHLQALAGSDSRIRFIPAVPMPEIVQTIARYDVGLFLLPPVNFNYRMALPNKFFEFIQARLMVAIGPSPEMQHYVDQYGCGVVAPDFEPASLARLLNGLTVEDIDRCKAASHVAAGELNAENNQVALRRLVLGNA